MYYISVLTYNSSNVNNLMLELEQKRCLFIKENCPFFYFWCIVDDNVINLIEEKIMCGIHNLVVVDRDEISW